MPVPTPPKNLLFTVTQKPPVPKKGMRADSKKLDNDIKKLTKELANSLGISEKLIPDTKIEDSIPVEFLKPNANSLKRAPFKPSEHLTQSPFRDNDALRKLSYDLKKETDRKKPVKRTPKRKPATTKTTGEK